MKTFRSYGPGGTCSEALYGWLLKFGEDITRIRSNVETFVYWLSNGIPPWAAYRKFMSVRLIALDQQPGVCPVDIGETWRRLVAKIVLKVMRPESTMDCQGEQLCERLKAGIDGAIHGVQALLDENLTTEEWGFFLVDAKNAFNEINQVKILCMVRHLWPPGACFVFN